jgi:glucan phosphorylase
MFHYATFQYCPSALQNYFSFQQGKQPSDSTVKKTVKEEKIRKKDDKSVEQVLKALNSLQTTEEKLAAMCKKYADIVDENRKLQVKSDFNIYFNLNHLDLYLYPQGKASGF